MNSTTLMLISLINGIVKTEAITEEKNRTVTAVFPNPSGGSPLQLVDMPGEDFKVILHKTPRYYPREPLSLQRIQKDIASYAAGNTAVLDFTYIDGTESKIDRITKTAEAENLTMSTLIDLSIRIRLMTSDELEDLLAGGGTVNVRFWNHAKDFRYRRVGDELVKC